VCRSSRCDRTTNTAQQDHFTIAPGAGFPDHPHRGQETITYLLSGAVDHEDFAGNKGTIHAGDLQFMTAGRGIVHAEMPAQNPDGSANIGMQLWVDLPAQLKDCEPRYRDLRASEIPVAKSEDGKVEVKVISGRAYGVDSLQELAYTPVWLLDVRVQPGGTFNTPLPHKWNAFIYTLSNSINLSSGSTSRTIPQYHNAVLEQEGDAIVASVPESADKESRFILVAGMPLDQPVSFLNLALIQTPLTCHSDYPIRSFRPDQHRGYLQGNGRLPRLH
jgi:redox-sensitive bicupin YhaK (pirin superfamily)